MPIPVGFKVNGEKLDANRIPISPRVRKIMDILNSLPANELLTTMEVSARLGLSMSGNFTNQPVLGEYREKVDNKLFWGNRASIAKLRKQLSEPEDTNENQ